MPAIKQELALRSAGRKGAIARLNAGLLSTHTHAHLSVNWFILQQFVRRKHCVDDRTDFTRVLRTETPWLWREAHSKGTGVEWPVPNQATYIG